MKYKLVALDIDNTLLRSDGTMSERTHSTIERVKSFGVVITFATGRSLGMVQRYLDLITEGTDLILNHGALTWSMRKNKVVHQKVVPKEILEDICKLGYLTLLQGSLDTYVKGYNDILPIMAKVFNFSARPLEELDFTSKHIHMILSYVKDKAHEDLLELILHKHRDKVEYNYSRLGFLCVSCEGVDKGKALAQLCHDLRIKREEVIAIGDDYADIGMLKYAGMGIAVANAPMEVKHASCCITNSNDEDGVAEALERLILGLK